MPTDSSPEVRALDAAVRNSVTYEISWRPDGRLVINHSQAGGLSRVPGRLAGILAELLGLGLVVEILIEPKLEGDKSEMTLWLPADSMITLLTMLEYRAGRYRPTLSVAGLKAGELEARLVAALNDYLSTK